MASRGTALVEVPTSPLPSDVTGVSGGGAGQPWPANAADHFRKNCFQPLGKGIGEATIPILRALLYSSHPGALPNPRFEQKPMGPQDAIDQVGRCPPKTGPFWAKNSRFFFCPKQPQNPFKRFACVHNQSANMRGGGGGGGCWHKALVVGSVSLWRRLLASRP